MKHFALSALFTALLGLNVSAQTPAIPTAGPAPDTVIATIDGKKLTFGELNSYISTLSQAQAKAAMENLEVTVRQYAMLNKLSSLGEKEKLDQQEPYASILRAGRMQVMAQAAISEQYKQTLIMPNEQEQYYKDHKAEYSKLKVKTIYIAFANAPAAAPSGKKYHTEEEARKIATDLAAKIRGGADFVALVKQYSEDDQSRQNNGDWGTVSSSDNLPADFKSAVLHLKIGEITDPMRRSGGFYIFKADSLVERSYAEVRDEIYNLMQSVRMRQWMDKMQQSIPIKMETPQLPAPTKPNAPAGQ